MTSSNTVGETNLNTLLRSMQPTLAEAEFVFVCLTEDNPHIKNYAPLQPIATFREQEGLTLILEKRTALNENIPFSGAFKCITLNVHSSLEAVGLTAAVANKLTEYHISANVVAAYYHDHIFVPAEKCALAMSALKELAKAS